MMHIKANAVPRLLQQFNILGSIYTLIYVIVIYVISYVVPACSLHAWGDIIAHCFN